MKLLKRYFWRAVMIPTLAILFIIVGLDCLFGRSEEHTSELQSPR